VKKCNIKSSLKDTQLASESERILSPSILTSQTQAGNPYTHYHSAMAMAVAFQWDDTYSTSSKKYHCLLFVVFLAYAALQHLSILDIE
jgi:hypothetical protein